MTWSIFQIFENVNKSFLMNFRLPLMVVMVLAIASLILGFCLEVLVQYKIIIYHLMIILIVSIIISVWQLIEVLAHNFERRKKRIKMIVGLLILQFITLSLRLGLLVIEGRSLDAAPYHAQNVALLISTVFAGFYIAHFIGLNLLIVGYFSANEQWANEQLSMAKATEAKLRERERLVHELHDGFGSQLVSARVQAQREGLSQAETIKVFNECIADLQLIVDVMKDDVLSLYEALIDLQFRLERRLQRSGIKLRFNLDVKNAPFYSQESLIQILRIVQEGISNAIQHSAATEIELNAIFLDQQLQIKIRDNGKGFDRATQVPGNGIRNMRRRAHALGAQLDIRSELGTTVELTLERKPT